MRFLFVNEFACVGLVIDKVCKLVEVESTCRQFTNGYFRLVIDCFVANSFTQYICYGKPARLYGVWECDF